MARYWIAANFDIGDLVALLALSALGYSLKIFGWPRAPVVLGFVLGRKMELYLWLSVARYGMEWVLRPGVIILFLLVLGTLAYPMVKAWREGAGQGVRP